MARALGAPDRPPLPGTASPPFPEFSNDLGGTLMSESITRAAGGVNGQELSADGMARLGRFDAPRRSVLREAGYMRLDPSIRTEATSKPPTLVEASRCAKGSLRPPEAVWDNEICRMVGAPRFELRT